MVSAKLDKREYKTNFLTNVIFRVDFPKILELSEKAPSEFQKKINDTFPILEEIKAHRLDFEVKSSEEDISLKQEKATAWQFSNKEKTKKIFLDPEFVYIEYTKYTSFEEFFTDIKFVFGTFTDLYPIKIAKRIGLRYINQIKIPAGDPFKWSGLIHENLLSTTEFVTKKDNIVRSMHLLQLREETNNLLFQFGFFNSEYPNPIARKEFALDYDCSTDKETEISEIYAKANEFHKLIGNHFEKSILEGLRTMMRGD